MKIVILNVRIEEIVSDIETTKIWIRSSLELVIYYANELYTSITKDSWRRPPTKATSWCQFTSALGVKSPPSFSPPPLPYLLDCCFTSWLRWKETHDWLASLAVIGCLCMEAILGDTVFSIHFIGSVISCVYKIFAAMDLLYPTVHRGLNYRDRRWYCQKPMPPVKRYCVNHVGSQDWLQFIHSS